MNASTQSKGWAGVAFAILVVAATILTGLNAIPPGNADAASISAYLSARSHALLIAGWLTFPISAFLLWFVVGIGQYLRHSSKEDDGLPTFALATGIFTAASGLVGAVLATALVYAGGALGSGPLQFIWSLQNLANGAFLSMGLALLIFACSHSMRQHDSAPAWLAWLGYLASLCQAALTFGVLDPSGLPGASAVLAMLGFILVVLWFICAGGYLAVMPQRAGAAKPA